MILGFGARRIWSGIINSKAIEFRPWSNSNKQTADITTRHSLAHAMSNDTINTKTIVSSRWRESEFLIFEAFFMPLIEGKTFKVSRHAPRGRNGSFDPTCVPRFQRSDGATSTSLFPRYTITVHDSWNWLQQRCITARLMQS